MCIVLSDMEINGDQANEKSQKPVMLSLLEPESAAALALGRPRQAGRRSKDFTGEKMEGSRCAPTGGC